MIEVLRNPVSVVIVLNSLTSLHGCGGIRCPCLHCSFSFGSVIRSHNKSALIYGLNMSTRKGRFPFSPIVVCSGESGLFYKEQKLPPWGSVEFDKNSVCDEHDGVSQLSRNLSRTISVNKYQVHLLEEMDEELLSQRLLMLSRTNKVRSAMELYRSMELSGLRPTLHACNSFLSCLLRNGLVDDALEVYQYMKINKMTTGHTHSLILKAVANGWGCEIALKMFRELEQECVVKNDFDPIVYNTMISACGKVNDWVETERIWRSMKESGLLGTQITYRLLVSIFVRSGQNELALDAYSEMVQNGLELGDETMQAVISACAKEGKWDLALSVFNNMLNSGFTPKLITCNALINSLGKAGEVKQAFRVYDIMKSLDHMPDVYTWNALLGALYRANRHADCLELFESIKTERDSQPNEHLYNTALMSCSKLGKWDRGLQLLWEMEASGLSISSTSYNLVISACEIARKPKIALQVYEHMVHQKCMPDTFTHLSLLRGCIWGSLWDAVEDILNQVAPDVSVYNTVIQGMCLRGRIDSAKKLYKEMQEGGLRPDGKTRALMLQNLTKTSVRRRQWPSRRIN